MSGKGSNRRRENREAVEANWPTTWDAREQEEQEKIPREMPRGDFDALAFHLDVALRG